MSRAARAETAELGSGTQRRRRARADRGGAAADGRVAARVLLTPRAGHKGTRGKTSGTAGTEPGGGTGGAAMMEFVEAGEGARIKVVGVGGGGRHAVNTKISAGLPGLQLIAAHTEAPVHPR